MLAIEIEVLVIDESGVEIAILTNCVIFAINALEAGAYNRLLETKFTPVLVM
jgi:hypothetical protein